MKNWFPAFAGMSENAHLRSFPRRREPRLKSVKNWISAFAEMSGDGFPPGHAPHTVAETQLPATFFAILAQMSVPESFSR